MSDALNQFGRLAGLTRPFVTFARHSWAGGVLLLVCAVVAIVCANSPWREAWDHFWHTDIGITFGRVGMTHSLAHWINDGLMVVFFLLVGLEIKREMISGELSTMQKAMLPIAGAIGGMVVPAGIYALMNHDGAGAHGWGIPMATDIAFALGIMRLVAGRIPAALFVFLTALAIADDLGAVLVIAAFYTANLDMGALAAAGALVAALYSLNRLGVTAGFPYVIGGIALWIAVMASGVHATIAGVLLALTIPLREDHHESTLHRWEHNLHPWITFVIVPVFALANAGVDIGGNLQVALQAPVFWGVVGGLVVGKPLGITGLAWLVVRMRLATLPDGVTWKQVFAVACLGGIGFTMSLFINSLAFSDALLIDEAKMGIIAASLAATAIGALLCRAASPRGPDGDGR
ncbi:MAG: Na+/H+ antiporter NhaA [Planctomycetes bacterium]|nr:Na+/H+ antiporter NhaA [Planctomycetota bacterium]